MIQQFNYIILFFLTSIGLLAQQSTASKQLSTFNIHSAELNCDKKIWVYLPKGYANSTKKFSVLYMHDAQNLFDTKTAYAGEWNVDEKLDSIKAQIIVIGIEHGNEKRIDELTPFKNEKHGGGNADNYLQFIVETLKPKIDSTYRTKTKARNTILMGSSLGGLVSYYGALKYPTIFGKAGVFSPSFWFSKEIFDYTEKSKKINTKIYFLCGDNEGESMVADLNKMERLLDKNRCYCLHLNEKRIVKGGQHNEKLWRDGFIKALLWLGY